eukprot:TRINITY_DN1352_c0_g1_i1.p1 TRINITY_DN1352_c0_g1~~TRINITY_DN1352_c0_g1_i1.p1  ORF type:complete len:575 (+),score=95.59 TRINITY_DN1352_c0_g1_i1:27-1751(+)
MLNTTLVTCTSRRTLSSVRAPSRLSALNVTHMPVNKALVRYASTHGHGHGHAAAAHPEVPPLGSVQYFKHYYGSTPEVKPGESWLLTALTSNGVLEALAEIASSEFKVTPLSGQVLRTLYKDQLAHFEGVRKPGLEKEGIPAPIINHLHKLYKLRAGVQNKELETVIKDTKFLPNANYRVTNSKSNFAFWKLMKAQFSAVPFSPEFAEGEKAFFFTNEAKADWNVKLFRGVRGFMKAVHKGLTDAQKDFVLSVVDKRLSTQDLVEIDEKINYIKRASQNSRSEGMKAIEEVFQAYPAGSPKREKFAEIVLRDDPAFKGLFFNTTLPTTVTARFEDLKKKLEGAVSKATTKHKDSGKLANLDKLSKAIQYFGGKDQQKDLLVLSLLSRASLNAADTEKLFSYFEDKETSDELLKNVINPHPIAAKLWMDRMRVLTYDRVQYTQNYSEGAESAFPDVSESAKTVQIFNTRGSFDSPTPTHPPYNTAMEEVFEMKLDRLAKRFYGYDLSTDFGLSQFDYLTQNYDISPGEATLERTHSYPPPAHTYDELPIIKFDGYDPLSDIGIAHAAKAEAHGHH